MAGGGVAEAASDLVAALLEPAGVQVFGDQMWRVGVAGVGEEKTEGSHDDVPLESAMGAI